MLGRLGGAGGWRRGDGESFLVSVSWYVLTYMDVYECIWMYMDGSNILLLRACMYVYVCISMHHM